MQFLTWKKPAEFREVADSLRHPCIFSCTAGCNRADSLRHLCIFSCIASRDRADSLRYPCIFSCTTGCNRADSLRHPHISICTMSKIFKAFCLKNHQNQVHKWNNGKRIPSNSHFIMSLYRSPFYFKIKNHRNLF